MPSIAIWCSDGDTAGFAQDLKARLLEVRPDWSIELITEPDRLRGGRWDLILEVVGEKGPQADRPSGIYAFPILQILAPGVAPPEFSNRGGLIRLSPIPGSIIHEPGIGSLVQIIDAAIAGPYLQFPTAPRYPRIPLAVAELQALWAAAMVPPNETMAYAGPDRGSDTFSSDTLYRRRLAFPRPQAEADPTRAEAPAKAAFPWWRVRRERRWMDEGPRGWSLGHSSPPSLWPWVLAVGAAGAALWFFRHDIAALLGGLMKSLSSMPPSPAAPQPIGAAPAQPVDVSAFSPAAVERGGTALVQI